MKLTDLLIVTLLLFVCAACQMGRIPCPKIKTAKLNKSFRSPSSSLSAKVSLAPESDIQQTKESRPSEVRFINNISVEEWDCPKPGAKHYMPKSVKENIRKNWKKFESDARKKNEADSVANR
jgi:hypothetical protein